jgi:hypothetical protein
MQMRTLGAVSVCIAEERGVCPLCYGKMVVQKTTPRMGRTLAHGPFEAQETIYVCAAGCRWPSGLRVTRRAVSLSEALVPNATIGYDVMTFVGLQRFLHHRQREEIQAMLLDEYSVSISTGEVSALSERFARYMRRLHHARSGLLRDALEDDGGWPLHVDATGEAGRGTLLIVMAGWRGWVLGAWKISTERADLVLPCLQQTVRRFGPPCAAMRDMGRAMTQSLNSLNDELIRPIPILACHQHFLADIGRDLLEPSHAQLRGLYRRTKVRPRLRELVRDLGRRIGKDIEEGREAVLEWQLMVAGRHHIEAGREGMAVVRALAQWVLDFKAQATGLDFPFDRPYLDLYDRCMTALRATDAFLRDPPDDKVVTSALVRLHACLEPVSLEVPFRQVTVRLRRRAALFDELRSTLRLTTTLPKDETVQDINEMHAHLDTWVESLRTRRPSRGPAQDMREAIDVILKHIATHGPSLWGHAVLLPNHVGEEVRLVARTNMLAENFFGKLKHDERRRSGRKNLGQDLEHIPAEAALIKNLKHNDYVAIVCGSLGNLPKVFAELDREDLANKLDGIPIGEQEDSITKILRISSSSLAKEDRRVVRNEHMDKRIIAAAKSRAPRLRL